MIELFYPRGGVVDFCARKRMGGWCKPCGGVGEGSRVVTAKNGNLKDLAS
ncbi:MAG: hypothetical protein IJW03_06155 [Clostridia bacterium]|nr:hypothetical protein [Clostridia bacterium]